MTDLLERWAEIEDMEVAETPEELTEEQEVAEAQAARDKFYTEEITWEITPEDLAIADEVFQIEQQVTEQEIEAYLYAQ